MNQETQKMILCSKCNILYSTENYYKKYSKVCKHCCCIYAKSRYIPKKPKKEAPFDTLTCRVCDINFPIDNFFKNHRRCKKCYIKINKNKKVVKSTEISQSEKNNIAKNVLLGKIKKLFDKYEGICKLQNDQEILNQASV